MEQFAIRASDGVLLRGVLLRARPQWAVLVHAPGADLDSWLTLPELLHREGWSVVAFDLRGHGASEGRRSSRTLASDLRAVVAAAEAAGAADIFLLAAGSSVGPALRVCDRARCAGLVALGPVGRLPLQRRFFPRLTLVTATDPRQQEAARALQQGPGPAMTVHVPKSTPEASLLAGQMAMHVQGHLRLYLRDQLRRLISLNALAGLGEEREARVG